jgi:hypothetical protein
MQTHTETANSGKTGRPTTTTSGTIPTPPHTVDELLALDHETLDALYAHASVPRLGEISGDLRGRMLAIPSLHGVVARAIRGFASSSRFPWRGKTFTPLADDHGEGVNRVVSDRWKLFRFTTSVGQSRAGAFDAVQLDYDHPHNPFFIRAIKDEIRELRPGLYLGQAWLQIGKRAPILGLWFGLQRPSTNARA